MKHHSQNIFSLIFSQITKAFLPSLKSSLWLLKMMIPITLVATILDFYGIIALVSDYTEPFFKLLGLSGEAAFVFITSCLTSIYSAIAVMATFGFELREVTIMASMCLIAHNLIVEGVIQSKSGSSFWGITILRIAMALACGFLLNIAIPQEYAGKLLLDMSANKANSVVELLSGWAISTMSLSLKILVIIYLLNILQNLLKAFRVIDAMIKYLSPLMFVLGLPKSTSFLWIVANTLGLAYGGAIIVAEINKGEMSCDDAKLLNTSIASTHSLVEDTALFLALGVGLWWLVLPRLFFSIVAVWSQRLLRLLKLQSSYRVTT